MLVNRLLNLFLSFFFIFLAGAPILFSADQKSQEAAKKISTQNIGGLLFDVDEGVKVEQGAGGSVYMRSNKEYMQEKLSQIDQKLSDLESRVLKLETKNNPKAQNSSSVSDKESENRRVLIT